MTSTARKLKLRIIKGHLKYVGIKSSTKLRYDIMVNRFFNYLTAHNSQFPEQVDELDYLASEFVNDLWLSGDSLGYANDFVSGLCRFIPRSRKHIPITRLYIQNWGRTISRKRALPLTAEVIQAMCGVAVTYDRPRLACAMMLGFTGLLRTDEVVRMEKSWVQFSPTGDRAVLTLHDSKRGPAKNTIEQVQIEDVLVVRLLRKICNTLQDDERIYNQSAKQLGDDMKWAARKFHLQHPRLTPYGLRRGGATHHFLTHGSYDRTAELGRWAQVKTARLYIEGGTADLGQWTVNVAGQQLMRDLRKLLREWMLAECMTF